MTSLTERIEAATGPCRDLDAEIAKALGVRHLYAAGNPTWRFTASLDAAMTLVVDGAIWGVGKSEEGSFAGVGDQIRPARGATPALALCAAALRARGVE